MRGGRLVIVQETPECAETPLILVVDTEPGHIDTLTSSLHKVGYRTCSARTGREALQKSRETPPDLVLLELLLPDMSGIEVCRQLRVQLPGCAPLVMMLTSKADEIDRVVAFELGADDFIAKPFSLRELMLRVRAALRRAKDEQRSAATQWIRFGVLSIDTAALKVWVAGTEVTLTALEFKLLTVLLERRGRVQTRTALLEQVWGAGAHVTARTVDTHVKRLRIRLGAAAHYLETIRGVGYRMRASPGG